MGGKPDHSLKADRPESGGADRKMMREKSGILEREKQDFAQEKHEEEVEARELAQPRQGHAPFSVGRPPEPDAAED